MFDHDEDEWGEDEPIRTLTTDEVAVNHYERGKLDDLDCLRALGYRIDNKGRLLDNFGDVVSTEFAAQYLVDDDRDDPTSVDYDN
jgi:hypothetical protein